VTSAPPGPPARVTLHAISTPGPRGMTLEAWVDDDFGVPVPAVSVALQTGGHSLHGITDAYGVVRTQVPTPEGDVHVAAQLTEVPGLRATLDLARTASGWRSFAQPEAETPPTPVVERVAVPLQPAMPVDLTVTLDPAGPITAGTPVRVRVEARSAGRRPLGALRLLAAARGATLTATGEAPAGTYGFTLQASRPGAVVLSFTEPRSGITAVASVTVR